MCVWKAVSPISYKENLFLRWMAYDQLDTNREKSNFLVSLH